MDNAWIDAWRTHSRLQQLLVDAIAPAALPGLPGFRGRSVGQMLAHIHNNRLSWLGPAAPDLAEGLAKVGRDEITDKALLQRSLQRSAQAIEALLQRSSQKDGKIKGFRGHAASFMGYMIAHDAYHHGEIGIALAQVGHPLDKEVAYRIWDWRSPVGT